MYSGNKLFIQKAEDQKSGSLVNRSVFYRELKPVILLMRMLGIFPYTLNKSGELQFKLLSASVAYSLLLQAAMMAMAACIVLERMTSILQEEATFVGHLLDGGFIVVLSPIFFIPVTYWIEVTKMLTFIDNHALFEEEFRALMHRDVQSSLKWSVRAVLCVSVVIIVLLEVDGFIIERGLSKWWHGIPFGFAVIMLVLMPFNWTSTCRELINIARDMALHIEMHVNEFARSTQAAAHRKLWLKLTYLTQDLGQAVGFTYGTLNLIYFTLELIATYGFLSEISNGFSVTVLVFMSAMLLFPSLIFIQCNIAQQATDEVGTKFQLRLEDVTTLVTNTDRTIMYNIRSFLKTIALNPPIISYCGFVDVNRGLLASFLSAKVTYMVVLMQFQMSFLDTAAQNKTQSIVE